MKDKKKKAAKKKKNDDDKPEFEILKKYKGGASVVKYEDNKYNLIKIPTTDDGKHFFQFGKTKAKAILEHIQSIDKFVKNF